MAPTSNSNVYMPYSHHEPIVLSIIAAAVKQTTCLLYAAAQREATVARQLKNSCQHPFSQYSNALFSSEWTDKDLFPPAGTNPVCLFKCETSSVMRDYNLREHFKTTH